MIYKYLKSLLLITLLTGCFQTEKSLLEDVTEYKYKAVICEASCVSQAADLDDAVAKAKIAGISEERIFAALDFGQVKAERELARLEEIRKNERLERDAKLKNKCALENKVVCEDRCCTKEEYLEGAAAETTTTVEEAPPADQSFSEASHADATTNFINDQLGGLAESVNNNPKSASRLQVRIKQGMEYGQARKILMDSGWQAVAANRLPNGTPVCFLVATMQDWSFQNEEACKYIEIDACSGTGMGFCKMLFHDGDKTFLSVITSGGRPPEAVVEAWSYEQKFEANVIALDEVINYQN